MNWYKKAQTEITYLGSLTFQGAYFVQFKIGDDYWAYRLSFPDLVKKVNKMAIYSPWRALDWVKKNREEAFKTTADFPRVGSIIREELSTEKNKGE